LASERVERRLTAILAADVAGYSRLTGMDEEGTHVQLKEHLHALVDPKISEHRGRVVKNTGDGLLAEFSSAVDAVRCAVDVQRGMSERNAKVPQDKRIEFRVGINVGDIIIDEGDIFGDGVNIAARLEGLAEPGGICVSSRVQEDVRGKLDIQFEDMGEQQLKNIEHPVWVYQVRLSGTGSEPRAKPTLALPDNPSIVVLPFQNLSGDPEQQYFADGVVEEIITALWRFKNLLVIARNSSFTYKSCAADVKQVGRELGVRYLLEGSVRKSANRVRITWQLINAATGLHLWADCRDGELEDIFALQDQVTASVVGAIALKVERAEIERARRKPTESLDAYDYYLRGIAGVGRWNRRGNSEALCRFYKAIELDRHFTSAHGMAAWCYVQRKARGWMTDRVKEIAETIRLGRRAVELGRDDAVALCMGGYALAFVAGELDDGAAFIGRALDLNPNLAMAWRCGGWVRVWLGEPEAAIEHLARAMPLSPFDNSLSQSGIAFAHFLMGRYDQASEWAKNAFREVPSFLLTVTVLTASSALAGRVNDTQRAVARLRQLDPEFRIANLNDLTPFRRPEDLARFAEGLRKAGLPE
jgi:TolB-like protein/class 3 adenylate cyclase